MLSQISRSSVKDGTSQSPLLFNHFIALDMISFLKIFEPLEAHATLRALSHLSHVFLHVL
jgi:hypothetical protein